MGNFVVQHSVLSQADSDLALSYLSLTILKLAISVLSKAVSYLVHSVLSLAGLEFTHQALSNADSDWAHSVSSLVVSLLPQLVLRKTGTDLVPTFFFLEQIPI